MKKILYIMTLILIISCEKEEIKKLEKRIVSVNEWQDDKEVIEVEVLDDDGMIYIDKDNFLTMLEKIDGYTLVEIKDEQIKFESKEYEVTIDFDEKIISKELMEVKSKEYEDKEKNIIAKYKEYDAFFLKKYDEKKLKYLDDNILIYDIAMFTNMNFQRDSKKLKSIYLTSGIVETPILMSAKTNEYSYEVLKDYINDLVEMNIIEMKWIEYLNLNKDKFVKNFYKEMKILTTKIDYGHFGIIISKNLNNSKDILMANKLEEIYNFENNIVVKIFDENTAYLKITSFDRDTYIFNELEEAMDKVYKYEKLIIDIRNNLGGVVDHRRYLLSLLTNKPVYEYNLIKEGSKESILTDISTKEYRGDLVVLVNRACYSAATMFTNNIKENNLGIIIGEKTGGGADPINKMVLPNGIKMNRSTMKVATNKEYISIDGGIEPDILIDDIATKKDRDPILTGALEYLKK